eukprot:CAMPEP_0174946194 /NCGR_PEP_ID=MMETSP1355-20121228/83497_1 /TAXON_ID=464990 /ORGANISM="Hemiselmis tepida, Strain CCMP443" /LENGTH=256 /DNA_ID=CAMNT_0016193607 /DNA_START=1 /DNA_END=768 /DNA_ORIENTATION=+
MSYGGSYGGGYGGSSSASGSYGGSYGQPYGQGSSSSYGTSSYGQQQPTPYGGGEYSAPSNGNGGYEQQQYSSYGQPSEYQADNFDIPASGGGYEVPAAQEGGYYSNTAAPAAAAAIDFSSAGYYGATTASSGGEGLGPTTGPALDLQMDPEQDNSYGDTYQYGGTYEQPQYEGTYQQSYEQTQPSYGDGGSYYADPRGQQQDAGGLSQGMAQMSVSSTGPYVPAQAEKLPGGKWPDPIEAAKARKAPVAPSADEPP